VLENANNMEAIGYPTAPHFDSLIPRTKRCIDLKHSLFAAEPFRWVQKVGPARKFDSSKSIEG